MESSRKRVKVAAELVEDDDEEALSPDEENIISASEDEEDSNDDRKHAKLLEAISSLGGKRRRMHAERSEASLQVSEFSVNVEGAGEKIKLSDLLCSVEKTPGVPNETKKQLRNLQNSKETLDLPLSRQQTEKIQRGVAYKHSRKEVSRWECVITQNQKAEQIIFPLNQETAGPKRVEQVVSGWKAQTPLEQQIFSLLHSNNQPIVDPVLTPVEEASISAMSLEEAKIRRAELQKARALQSYYEAKARREKKIKSKKYHKVQKKAKRKEFLKQFDEMMKTDPTAALDELKKMELSRMEERMSLKHQNSGKWAKTKAIMAKYDDSARKAMQQQLELNKELTQKLVVPSDDDEEKDEEEASALPDFVNEAESASGSVNPWMRGKLSSEGHEVTTDPDTTNTEEPASILPEEEEPEEEEENEEEQLLRHFETKRKLRQNEEDGLVSVARQEEAGAQEDSEETAREEKEEEEEQEEVVSEFNSLFNRLMKSARTPTEPPPPGKAGQTQEAELVHEEEGLLDEGLVHARTMEDLEALEHDGIVKEMAVSVSRAAGSDTPSEPHSTKKKKKEIDPSEVLTKDAAVIKVALAPTLVEGDEGEEEEGPSAQMSIIKEAFAGDDVISDFLKDKKKQEEAGQPKVVDLTLPGWGEWGGIGLKPSRRKRRKFRLKPPPAAPRKDQKLPAVILSEKRNSSVALHQVSQLPFPFQDSAQFETCIRSPVGQTWNTQNTVKKLTAPRVVTKLGSIIEPLRKEDFLPEEKSAGVLKKQPQIVLEENGGKAWRGGGGARRTQQKKKK